jgi:hypothetical protein
MLDNHDVGGDFPIMIGEGPLKAPFLVMALKKKDRALLGKYNYISYTKNNNDLF